MDLDGCVVWLFGDCGWVCDCKGCVDDVVEVMVIVYEEVVLVWCCVVI